MIPKHLQIALSYLGEREVSGKESNPFIAECLKSVGMPENDEVAWCAAFVNKILELAGLKGTGKALAKSYLNWGEECKCEPGAIAIQDRGSNPIYGHVSFVLQDNWTYVYTIGGNQSDSVTITTVLKKNIISFRKAV